MGDPLIGFCLMDGFLLGIALRAICYQNLPYGQFPIRFVLLGDFLLGPGPMWLVIPQQKSMIIFSNSEGRHPRPHQKHLPAHRKRRAAGPRCCAHTPCDTVDGAGPHAPKGGGT